MCIQALDTNFVKKNIYRGMRMKTTTKRKEIEIEYGGGYHRDKKKHQNRKNSNRINSK